MLSNLIKKIALGNTLFIIWDEVVSFIQADKQTTLSRLERSHPRFCIPPGQVTEQAVYENAVIVWNTLCSARQIVHRRISLI